MEIRKAERKKAKIKMAIQGSSGAGKTYSALLIAYGLCGDWNKIVIIDTENNSADLYSNLGDYNVLNIQAPYTPEKYIEAIQMCLKALIEVIIIDSTSHCWDYLIDLHANMSGNSFTNWSKITPRQNAFINAILQADCHIISTMRVKQDYVLNQKDGKYVPEKVGLKAVQRDGVDYEFTLVLDIDAKHHATASKDRTNLFVGKPEFQVTQTTGQEILEWCNDGKNELQEIKSFIDSANSVDELLVIYTNYPFHQQNLANEFTAKKEELQKINQSFTITKFNQDGSIKISR
ncbi:AAA family ATPase [Pedobacter sp. Leaf41]|uniref:AAA family ATPase n=1 Tax=Pedobacter sp. Leaf41 TaxID=1736218 RepID=UPI0007034E5C|nr:AAA family ATPase [Pedobacter sp. Leaf41]KQN32366.1 AAA family ATPase [Pedobacter sp. Leaf41]